MFSLSRPFIFFTFAISLFASLEGRAAEFRPWTWLGSDCANCSIVIQPVENRSELESSEVKAFLRALETQKPQLLSLYGVHGQEYNLLAHMAVGILGRESAFFESTRYQLKEMFPGVVKAFKVVKAYVAAARGQSFKVSSNSRGPTQIKRIPDKIIQAYAITTDDLGIPENAAVATMGYLIEALQEMKRRIEAGQLTYIQPQNYVDYLPYLYFGSGRTLVTRVAEPHRNLYVRAMKSYMSWVQVYESTEPAPVQLR